MDGTWRAWRGFCFCPPVLVHPLPFVAVETPWQHNLMVPAGELEHEGLPSAPSRGRRAVGRRRRRRRTGAVVDAAAVQVICTGGGRETRRPPGSEHPVASRSSRDDSLARLQPHVGPAVRVTGRGGDRAVAGLDGRKRSRCSRPSPDLGRLLMVAGEEAVHRERRRFAVLAAVPITTGRGSQPRTRAALRPDGRPI